MSDPTADLEPPAARPPLSDLLVSRPALPPTLPERLRAAATGVPSSLGRVVGAVLLALVGVGVGVWLLRAPAPPIEGQLPLAPGAQPDDPGSGPKDGGSGPTTAASAEGPAGATGAGSGEAPGDAGPGSGEAPGGAPDEGPTQVVVHAIGAVNLPGLYRLPPSARVADLVEAAGGFAADADPDRLNLAAPLADGVRVWVPRRGEAEGPPVVNGDGGGAVAAVPPVGGDAAAATGPVDLNTATLEVLDTLPGVGPSTAQAIIDHRTTNGPFRSVDDLLEVRGIGDAKLAQLRDKVRV
jgi:competence protein ComEA